MEERMRTGIKGILFDLDNTLIDRQAAADAKVRKLVDELFPQLQDEPVERENIVQKLLTWDEYGSIPKIHMYSMLAKEYGLSQEQVDALCQDWYDTFGDYTVVFPQARRVVEQLKKKYKVGIVTNGNSHMQRRKLELCGLADLFEVIVISGEFKAHKPDVEIFLEGARQLELPPEEIAFVGDTFFTDIIGAYRAGMQPIWIFANPGQQCQADLPRIYRIEELLDLL
jgi:putative hydrolase of the HAD superfamily